jgi:PAS domain-containing protein/CheY-like chemotaxis protein
MEFADLIAALLLPLPPWLGFWIFRWKGRVGLSYGYFLGGILCVLAFPWDRMTSLPLPTAQLGGALFGFTLYLQAQREGAQGIRRLAVGVGGATLFLILLLWRLRLPWHGVGRFWASAVIEALLWLLASDLSYRWTHGRHLEVRMPLVGATALGLGALAQTWLPPGLPRLAWPAALLGGLLLGLVALQQLRWLRSQGAWVEGRGEGLRLALALLDQKPKGEAPSLALGLEAHQAIWLVDSHGRILDSNGPFSRLVGLPRHQLRGYGTDALFQGGEASVWEGLQRQLLQYGCASVQATQVSDDGTFSQVDLEATAFDRGMALVWIEDGSSGSLRLRGGGGTLAPSGDDAPRRHQVNALLALHAAIQQLETGAEAPPGQASVEQIRTAVARLAPPPMAEMGAAISDGRAALESLLPRLKAILPAPDSICLQAAPLALALDLDTLQRITTHLVLNGIERSANGQVNLTLEPVQLGGRRMGLLRVEEAQPRPSASKPLFGLGWLRQAVQKADGLLELDQDSHRGFSVKVYLPSPVQTPLERASSHNPLEGRRIWVVDQDPLAREALLTLLRLGGAEGLAFEDLKALLQGSRSHPAPDVLILERTPHLERFQRALRTFQKEPIPTLVLGMGQPLPLDPGSLGLRRLGFLEKPFAPEALIESLLALLRSASGADSALL